MSYEVWDDAKWGESPHERSELKNQINKRF